MNNSQSGNFRRFPTSFQHPLHSDADSQKGLASSNAFLHGITHAVLAKLSRRSKVSHSRKDELVRTAHKLGVVRNDGVHMQMIECFLHGRQIAGLVIDDGDHSNPFVLGNILASRLSREQAKRNARAKALNSASSL